MLQVGSRVRVNVIKKLKTITGWPRIKIKRVQLN